MLLLLPGFLRPRWMRCLRILPISGTSSSAELMDFCYVWLRRLVGDHSKHSGTTLLEMPKNLPAMKTWEKGWFISLTAFLPCFDGLRRLLRRVRRWLSHIITMILQHYHPFAVAILDVGLTCSASLPCPAEMGASIHINGTGSSIIDTVFVCRSTGSVPKKWVVDSIKGVAELVEEDLANSEPEMFSQPLVT